MGRALATVSITLLLMALTGLMVVAIYQQQELDRLRGDASTISTADSADAEREAIDSTKQGIHQQLRNTCENWQRWYAQDGKALSLANRDSACRRSDEYGAKELGLDRAATEEYLREAAVAAPRSRVVRIQRAQESDQQGAELQSLEEYLEAVNTER